eukprot:TRINITY_DN2196_c0_g1_i2.p4 TRINITY_DN2196_c0_g1~~TRINITY_DN2196_c0_g1_i2.p4  ORF type:complete len:171 (-),score=22.43 TRINITY_DN2196_c0_g1_i2:473-985(-)
MYKGGYVFYAGRSGDFEPYPVAKAVDAVISRKYADLQDEHDYGVIILDRELGAEAGWLGMGVNCADTEPKNINIAGYPYDLSLRQDHMYKSSCEDVVIDQCQEEAGYFDYTCDTQKGMSGAPIWIHFENQHMREIRGIHVQGRRLQNLGVYLSPKIFKFISNEINSSNYL